LLNLEYCSLCKVEVTNWRAHCQLPEHQKQSRAHIGQHSCTKKLAEKKEIPECYRGRGVTTRSRRNLYQELNENG
jgi:hypothetical protein